MSAAVELPKWAVYAVSIGTPVASFIAVSLGNLFNRRGAKELDRRARREEVMRNLRWAAEMAVSDDNRAARLGVAELRALAASNLLDAAAQGFIDAALESVVKEPLEELEEAGDNADVIEIVNSTVHAGTLDDDTDVLPSTDQSNEASEVRRS